MLEAEHLGLSLHNTAAPSILPALCAWLDHQPDSSRAFTSNQQTAPWTGATCMRWRVASKEQSDDVC